MATRPESLLTIEGNLVGDKLVSSLLEAISCYREETTLLLTKKWSFNIVPKLKGKSLSGLVMNLKGLLLQKKSAILDHWYNLILESCPADTQKFFKKQKNRFANPVAYEFRQGIEGIFETLLHGMEGDDVTSCLDRIISIRAIQNFLPSVAIAFIFLLKKAIRETLKKEIREEGISEALIECESRIDGLALLCFDLYMKRREKLFEIRVNEVKNRASVFLRRAGLTPELEEEN